MEGIMKNFKHLSKVPFVTDYNKILATSKKLLQSNIQYEPKM